MYGFLLRAKPFTEERYDFFTYQGAKPIPVQYKGVDYQIMKGQRFGVRPSSNGKFIRLIFPQNHTRVFTINMDTAKKLAKFAKA